MLCVHVVVLSLLLLLNVILFTFLICFLTSSIYCHRRIDPRLAFCLIEITTSLQYFISFFSLLLPTRTLHFFFFFFLCRNQPTESCNKNVLIFSLLPSMKYYYHLLVEFHPVVHHSQTDLLALPF